MIIAIGRGPPVRPIFLFGPVFLPQDRKRRGEPPFPFHRLTLLQPKTADRRPAVGLRYARSAIILATLAKTLSCAAVEPGAFPR